MFPGVDGVYGAGRDGRERDLEALGPRIKRRRRIMPGVPGTSVKASTIDPQSARFVCTSKLNP